MDVFPSRICFGSVEIGVPLLEGLALGQAVIEYLPVYVHAAMQKQICSRLGTSELVYLLSWGMLLQLESMVHITPFLLLEGFRGS